MLIIPRAWSLPACWVVCRVRSLPGRSAEYQTPAWPGEKSLSECARVRNGSLMPEKHLSSGWFSDSVINVRSPAHTKEKGTFGYRARLFQELIYFEDFKCSSMLPSSLVNPVPLPVK